MQVSIGCIYSGGGCSAGGTDWAADDDGGDDDDAACEGSDCSAPARQTRSYLEAQIATYCPGP